MDVDRLKKGTMFTDEYFDRQLEYIQKFACLSENSTKRLQTFMQQLSTMIKMQKPQDSFFKTVQNKMHYATHRHTAAELIVERADAEKEHMGLTSWENAPDGKIVKSDVSVAKTILLKKNCLFGTHCIAVSRLCRVTSRTSYSYEYGGLGEKT